METWITLTDAAKLMRGRAGRRPSIDSIRRWASVRKGCRPSGQEGPVVYLQVVRVNGELLTTAEWVHEFERERVRLGARERPPFLGRTDRQRERAYKRACARLDAEGV